VGEGVKDKKEERGEKKEGEKKNWECGIADWNIDRAKMNGLATS
jgi:hypothetical protein